MPSVLRKRKAPVTQHSVTQSVATEEPATKKKKNSTAKGSPKAKKLTASASRPVVSSEEASKVKKEAVSSSRKVVAGDTIALEGFGEEIETHEGEKTTLQKLVEASENGVVLFTYPKANTPGCTSQACLFRDQYSSLTSTGFSIYGLSKDSTKSNTNFKIKQKLPYSLLCDPSATLIKAIGLNKFSTGITRGVFVIDKSGKVLAVQSGGPAATVNVVKDLIESHTVELSDTFTADSENHAKINRMEKLVSKSAENSDASDT